MRYRRKIFMPDKVVRLFTYGLLFSLLSNIPLTVAYFGSTPFAYNDDDIKEPEFSNPTLNRDYQDLESIYDDTAKMLYNATGDEIPPDIHQVYPSQDRQNYTEWFDDLINNTNNVNLPVMYNFSRLFPGVNTSKDAYYRMPDTFRVFPSDKNVTLLHLVLPPNATKLDSSIFQNAYNDSSSSKNNKDIYLNMPPINSMSLNKLNKTNLVNKFFHSNTSPLTSSPTSTPSMPSWMSQMPPTAVLQRPPSTPTNSTSAMNTLNTTSSATSFNSHLKATDLLAKRISEDETKNGTSFIYNMLRRLGLGEITTDGDPTQPMYVYRFNNADDDTANSSDPQNFTIPEKDFYFEGVGPNSSSLVLPTQNNSNNIPNPIPYLNTGNGYQNSLTYYRDSGNMQMNRTAARNITFSAMANDSVSNIYGEIVYTTVYFVSGSSTPPQPYPNDPYRTYWTEGINELTNDGKTQLYKLGKWLRERYQSMLGHQFNSSLVSIDSGASDIAITSAQTLAAGLFPPSGKEIWNQLMMWQPTPVRTIPAAEDNMILMSKFCEQYKLQTEDLNRSPDWLKFYDSNNVTINTISQNTGYNFTKYNLLDALQKIFYCYEDLRIEEENKLTLPSWTSAVYPDSMMNLAQQYIEYAVETRNLQKIKTGPFFKTIINNMSAKINNSTNGSSKFLETMHLYSGDVLGVGFIMKTLGIFNSIIPPDASALIFDLRYKENDFLITISYKNSSSDTLYLLTVPQCNPVCKFSKFVEITNDLMMDDWDNYCETTSIFDLTYVIPIIIFGVAIIIILALVVILLCVKCCKHIRKKQTSF